MSEEKKYQTFEEWKAELIHISATQTGNPEHEIKINDSAAREWYEDGWPPYFCFRENWCG